MKQYDCLRAAGAALARGRILHAAAKTSPNCRLAGRFVVLAITGLALSNCSSMKDSKLGVSASPRVVEYGEPVPKGGGVYKVGNPYQIGGEWFYPKEDPNYRNVGTASWYGLDFHGRRTANGEVYDMDALSAAHPTLPLPTYAKVKNLENGREVVVRINDRGPFARGREIDVSKRTAELLGFRDKGTAKVEVSYLGRAPLSGDDGWATNVRFAKKSEKQPKVAQAQQTEQTLRQPQQHTPVRVASADVSVPAARQNAGGGSTYIQVASYREPDNAERMRARLAPVGHVNVTPIDVGGVIYYRVRVGPVAPGDQAASALSQVWAAGANGARLVVEH